MNLRILLKGFLLIGSLLLLGYLFQMSQLDKAWVDAEVRGKGFAGEILFVAVGALFTALPFPRQVVSFLAGYAFGFVAGSLLAVLATALGCILTFHYARFFGRGFVNRRFLHRVQKIDDFIRDNTLNMTLLIRLLPLGSNFATNLAAGVTTVRGLPFFSGSILGYIPQSIVFALIGSGINVDPVLRIGLGVVLFLVSGLLGGYLYRKYRHGKTLDGDTEL